MQPLRALVAIAMFAAVARAQTAVVSGTLNTALTISSATVNLAANPGAVTNQYALVGVELMYIRAVQSPNLTVTRGASGTIPLAHALGANAWIAPLNAFVASDPSGACVRSSLPYVPVVSLSTGNAYDCVSSVYVLVGSSGVAFGISIGGTGTNGITPPLTPLGCVSVNAAGTALTTVDADPCGTGGATGAFNSTSYNFTPQTPGGTLTAATPATITVSPCPAGVNGADVNHPLRISAGTGTAEAVIITAGSCTSGAGSGTLTFTPANNHSGAWTVSSATSGIREAFIAAAAVGQAVYTPSGTHNFYATLYNDAPVPWFGDGPSSIIQQQFAGDGIIVGRSTYSGYYTSVRDLFGQYGFGVGAFASTGSLWTFRNISNGDFSNLYSFLGYAGFKFAGVTQANWSNFWSTSGRYAYYYVAPTGTGAGANAGAFNNLWGTTTTGGLAIIQIEPTVAGLTFNNLNIGGSALYGIRVTPGATGQINELVVNGGFIDSAVASALKSDYYAGTGSATGSSLIVSNVGLNTAGSAVVSVVDLAYPLVWKLNDNRIYNGGSTGDIMSLSGMQNSTFTSNHLDSAIVGSRVVFQAAPGAQVNSNNLFSGNTVGFNGASLTNSIVSDAAAHTGQRFTGNKLNGATAWSATGAGNQWDNSYNYIASETGSNNAIAGALVGVPLVAGTQVTVLLAHSLQVGANTFTFNGTSKNIRAADNPANNIATAYVSGGTISLGYDGTQWLNISGGGGGGGSAFQGVVTTSSVSGAVTLTRTATVQTFNLTLTGNVSGFTLSGFSSGDTGTLRIIQDSAPRTVTYGASLTGGSAPCTESASTISMAYFYSGSTMFLTVTGYTGCAPALVSNAGNIINVPDVNGSTLANLASVQALTNKSLGAGTTLLNSLPVTAVAAPSTPAAGIGAVYVDSTSKNIAVKDDAGVVKHGAQTKSCVGGESFSSLSDAGLILCSSNGAGGSIVGNWTEYAGGLPFYSNLIVGAASGSANTVRCGSLVPRTTMPLAKMSIRLNASAPGGTGVAVGMYDVALGILDQTTLVAITVGVNTFTMAGGVTLMGGNTYWACYAAESVTTQPYSATDADNTVLVINAGGTVLAASTGNPATLTGASFALPANLGSLVKATTAATTAMVAVHAN